MPRPRKDTVDYFSHDKDMRNDPKVKALRTKFGLKGYALWGMFLETLCDSENLQFKETEISITLIAGDFGVSEEEINEFLSFCYRIDLLQPVNGVISSRNLKKRLQQVFDKRENLRKKYESKRSSTIVSASEIKQVDEFQQEENTQSKGEESKDKVNKSKEEKRDRLLQSLKEGMIQTWQYLEKYPEPELTKDAIKVITSLRDVRGSSLDPGKVEIETLIHNWLFGGVEKDVLLKMIKGASTDEFEVKNLTIEYILKPKHREKLLMKAEEVVPGKSKNNTESAHIEHHQKTLDQEKSDNLEYQLATSDEKLKIVLGQVAGKGGYGTLSHTESYKEEIHKRISEFIKLNKTERSTVMIGVNLIVSNYMEELN